MALCENSRMSQTYFLKLIGPRPSFAFDMTADERALMMQHVTYARQAFADGKLLAFGPVLDPEDSFGIALLQADSEDEVKTFISDDPTVQAGMNRYTYAPMQLGGAQAPRAS
jgi:uncharacterized protein YciI